MTWTSGKIAHAVRAEAVQSGAMDANAAAEDNRPLRDGMPRAATAIAVAAWGLAVLATVLLVSGRPPVNDGLWFFLVDVTVACVYGTVGSLILARRRHPVAWILAVAALGGGLAALGFGAGMAAGRHPGLAFAEPLAPLQGIAWVPGTLSLFLVVPWLVRNHRLGAAVWGAVAGAAITVAVTAMRIFLPSAQGVWLFAAAVTVGLAAAAEAEWRHRRGPAAERNGLGWLALGTSILAISFIPLALPWGMLPLPIWTTPALHLASQAVFPAAVLVAVLRGRMWGLDLLVSRAVVAGLLTVLLVGLYLGVTLALTRVLPGEGTAHLVAAGAVAVAVQPARLRLQRHVHRLVHGSAADPAQVVRRLGSQLGAAGTAEELLLGLAQDIGSAMRLRSVAVVPDGLPALTWGEPGPAPTVVQLLHRGLPVGRLEATLPPGERLDPRGEQTLRDLAAVVATAVAVARAAHDVEAARARLASARLEERRVIRREIHDGLGPSLAGLRLGLQGARNLLESDPAAAAELLTALQTELDQRVADVRSLSHSLLPPVLDELGLGAALQELRARHAEDGLLVDLRIGRLEGLGQQVAAAAYGILSEALTNVARHSAATRCLVTAGVSDARLLVAVEDDGVGIAADARPGVGSRSMRERAEEQGGELHVEPGDRGGTRVRALLPLPVGVHD